MWFLLVFMGFWAGVFGFSETYLPLESRKIATQKANLNKKSHSEDRIFIQIGFLVQTDILIWPSYSNWLPGWRFYLCPNKKKLHFIRHFYRFLYAPNAIFQEFFQRRKLLFIDLLKFSETTVRNYKHEFIYIFFQKSFENQVLYILQLSKRKVILFKNETKVISG